MRRPESGLIKKIAVAALRALATGLVFAASVATAETPITVEPPTATATGSNSPSPAVDGADQTPSTPPTVPSGTPAPDVVSPAAEPARAELPPNPAAPRSSCVLPEDIDPTYGLDWARRNTFRSVCVTARWLDGMFGDDPFEQSGGRVTGLISLALDKRDGESIDVTPKLRVSLRLPNLSRHASLFFDRDKESQSIAGDTTALRPEVTKSNEMNTSQAGIGYELFKAGSALVDFRLGVRFDGISPKPFVRSRYSLRFAESSADRWLVEETLYWKTVEGFGETTRLEYERHLGGPFILRWDNGATYDQSTIGVSWSTTVSVFHALSVDRGMQWSYGASGQSDLDYTIGNFGPRVSLRQRMKQRWLFLEVYTGVDNTRSEPNGPLTRTGYFGAKMEALFDPPR